MYGVAMDRSECLGGRFCNMNVVDIFSRCYSEVSVLHHLRPFQNKAQLMTLCNQVGVPYGDGIKRSISERILSKVNPPRWSVDDTRVASADTLLFLQTEQNHRRILSCFNKWTLGQVYAVCYYLLKVCLDQYPSRYDLATQVALKNSNPLYAGRQPLLSSPPSVLEELYQLRFQNHLLKQTILQYEHGQNQQGQPHTISTGGY